MYKIVYLTEGFYIHIVCHIEKNTFPSKCQAKRFLKMAFKKGSYYCFKNQNQTFLEAGGDGLNVYHKFKNHRIEEFEIVKIKED